MRLSLDALLVLDAIDRKGSFAAAAEVLFRVPSAITYTVQKLEQDLDVTLFDRSGHKAKLTEAGQILLRDGRCLLQAAEQLEHRVKHMGNGWESELIIAVGDLMPMPAVLALIKPLLDVATSTDIKIIREVFGGAWDALIHHRAHIVIGAPDEGPAGGGYNTLLLGEVPFVFCVPPGHELLNQPQPVPSHQLRRYPVVIANDSSQRLPPRAAGVIDPPHKIGVPDIQSKLLAQLAGLGIGFLPLPLAAPYLAQGQLIEIKVEEFRAPVRLMAAWPNPATGHALCWLIEALHHPGIEAKLQQV